MRGDALPIFWEGWGNPIRVVDSIGDELYPEVAEDRMRKDFENTSLTTWDFGPDEDQYIGPGYTTEEDEIYHGKENKYIDLTSDE